MIGHYVVQGAFVLIGLFALLASIGNWEWFFNTRNARLVSQNAGRTRARTYYGALGIALIVTGVLFFCSVQGWL